jgi:hypothetical protein
MYTNDRVHIVIKYNSEVTLHETRRNKLDYVHRNYVETAVYITLQ